MKLLLFFCFVMYSNLCIAQSDYVLVEKKNPTKYSIYSRIVCYDTIKNLTTISVFDNHYFTLVGKWYDFDYQKYEEEHLVSHCPLFVNEDNFILEIGRFDYKFHRAFTGSYDIKDFNKNLLLYNKRKKSILLSSNTDKEKKIYLHKFKSSSRFNKDVFFTSYQFAGEKNDCIYRMALYNIDETNFENFDQFLITIFETN